MVSDFTNCKVCGTILRGPFCSDCGQKGLERYTLKKVFGDLVSNIFNLEKGFFFTTKKLILAPEEVIGGYLDGQTKKYYNPIRFFLIWVSIQVLLTLSFNILDNQFEQVGAFYEKIGIMDTEADKARMDKVIVYVKRFLTIIPLLLIPFYSFLSYKIFASRKLYYAEHCILNVYVIGMSSVLGLAATIIYILFPSTVEYSFFIGMLTFVALYSYTYKRFFKSDLTESILFGFITVAGGYLLFLVSLLVFGIILGILIGLTIAFLKKYFG